LPRRVSAVGHRDTALDRLNHRPSDVLTIEQSLPKSLRGSDRRPDRFDSADLYALISHPPIACTPWLATGGSIHLWLEAPGICTGLVGVLLIAHIGKSGGPGASGGGTSCSIGPARTRIEATGPLHGVDVATGGAGVADTTRLTGHGTGRTWGTFASDVGESRRVAVGLAANYADVSSEVEGAAPTGAGHRSRAGAQGMLSEAPGAGAISREDSVRTHPTT